MAFNIPIQQRDAVELQNTPMPQDDTRSFIAPFDKRTLEPLQQYSEAVKKQENEARIKAYNFAKNKFENERDTLVDSELAQVTSAEGENSFIVADRSQKTVKDKLTQSLQKVPEEYRADFSMLANEGLRRFDKTSIGHQYRQQNIVMDQTAKDRANYLTDQMAQSAFNPEKFSALKSELEKLTEQETRRKMGGLGGEPVSKETQLAIDIHKREANSLAITKSIESMVSAEYVDSAYGFAKKYENELTAQDKVKVNSLLNKGRGNQKYNIAKDLLDRAMQAFPNNPVAQRQYISDRAPDGEIYNTAVSMHTSQTSFEKQQKDIADERSMAYAMGKIRDSFGDNNKIQSIIKGLPLEKRAEAQRYAISVSQGEAVLRDSNVYHSLDDMYNRAPEKFANVDLNAYIHKLPKEDIKAFESKQKEVREPLAGKMTVKDVSDITNRIINSEVATVFGYKTDKYKNESAAFKSLGDKVFSELQAAPGNDRISRQELRDKFEKEMILRTRKIKTLNTWDKFVNIVEPIVPFVEERKAGIQDPAMTNLQQEGFNVQGTTLLDDYPIPAEQIRSKLKAQGKTFNSISDENREVLKWLKEAQFRGILK